MKNFFDYLTENHEEVLNTIERLKSPDVSYMELKESKFRCAECYFITGNYCKNNKIKSNVSYDGCCNLYIPKRRDEVDSVNWKI